MNKNFVLVSITRGDDLRGPRQSVVASSKDKEKLEKLRRTRAKERNTYLANNTLPEWTSGSIISSEEIQEVEVV